MAILSRSKITSRVTQELEEYIASLKQEEGKILIRPFDDKSMGPTSYDLHIGERYISLIAEPCVKKAGERPIRIEPRESVTIVSQEYIGLPHDVAGMIFAKVSWLERGLSQISSYVHPGFHGHLAETLTNTSDGPLGINRGSSFCQIVFHEVPEGTFDERYTGSRVGQTVDHIMNRLMSQHANPYRVEAMRFGTPVKVLLKRTWNNVRPDNIKFKRVEVDRRTGNIVRRVK